MVANHEDANNFYNNSIIEYCCCPYHIAIPFYVYFIIGSISDSYFHKQTLD